MNIPIENLAGHHVHYHGSKTDDHGLYEVESVMYGRLTIRRLVGGRRYLTNVHPESVTIVDMDR